MIRIRWPIVAALAALCGCSGGITEPTAAAPADGLLVTVEVGGECVFTCDPPSGGVTRALVTLENSSDSTVFVAACQNFPLLTEEQLVRGKWTTVGPAVTCVQGPPSFAVAAHASFRMNSFFAGGTRRLVARVSTSQSLTESRSSASASFEVPPTP